MVKSSPSMYIALDSILNLKKKKWRGQRLYQELSVLEEDLVTAIFKLSLQMDNNRYVFPFNQLILLTHRCKVA